MKPLFDLLATSGVTPNGWCQLYSMYKSISYTNYLNAYTELSRLERAGMIRLKDVVPSDRDKMVSVRQYEITSKGLMLLEEAEKVCGKPVKTKTVDQTEEYRPYIEEFRKLFPGGKQGSKPYRSNFNDCYPRFVWFFEKYPQFSWKEVLDATRQYVQSTMDTSDGARYLKTAGYFIKKQDSEKMNVSNLADWCQMLVDGDLQEDEVSGAFTVNLL